MIVTLPPSPDAFESALKEAGRTEAMTDQLQMAAPMDAGLRGRVDTVWRCIKEALTAAFEKGHAAAAAMIEETAQTIDDLFNSAQESVEQMRDELLSRLRRFVQQYFLNAAATLPTEMMIGPRQFKVSSLRCTQRIMLGGTIKSSLAEIISLVSDGQLSFEATFEPAG